MPTQIADATLLVNNEVIGYLPNTLKFTEGLGEQNMRAVSVGGGSIEQVYSQNLETSFADISFELPVTKEMIELARTWKLNGNENVVQIVAENADGAIDKTFTGCALTGNYEVELGAETSITIEMMGNTAA